MSTLPCFKLLQISVLFLMTFGVPPLVQAQTPIRLQGRVLFSTGEPASGATVTMTKSFYDVSPPVTGTETTVTDGGGHYSFTSEGRCAVSYEFKAESSEIVDGEPLPPAANSISGCVLGDTTIRDLEIARPHLITLGGIVFDETNRAVQGLTVTMTRTKYDLNPNVVTTETTTSDGSGHYQFTVYSRCSIVEAFKVSANGVDFQGGISTSGCVLDTNNHLDIGISMGSNLQNAGNTSCNSSVAEPINVTNGNMYLQQTDYQLPGVGEGIVLNRTYNSISTNVGLFGRRWTSSYEEAVSEDANGRLQLTMPDGRLITFATPDFFGQMIKNGDGSYTVTFKDGHVHQFNSSGKLLSQTDRLGNQTTLAYDTAGKLTSVTDSSGRVLSFATETNGRVLSIADALGTIATYTYGDGNLLAVTYADNSAFQFSYDGNYRLTTVTDALGNIIESHTYDDQGRALTSQRHNGVEGYTLDYVSLSETDVTDALGHVTKYFYGNIRGRRIVTRVEGLCNCGGGGSQVQTWTYDNQLNVTSKTDALNHVTSYTYDANGNRLTETDSLGTTTYTYNNLAEVLTTSDKLGGVTTNTYDPAGNLLTMTDARGKTANFTNGSRGMLLSVTDARGKTTSFAYDASGNLIARTDAFLHDTQFTYDARGRVTSTTNALGFVTSFAYDLVGRLTQVTQADGTTNSYEYDLAGRRAAMIDAKGNRSTFAYDAANRLVSQTDALNQLTAYSYDLMSNPISSTDALGRTTNFDYDDFNRLVKTTYPAATAGATRLFEMVEYDAGGNVVKSIDTAGRASEYHYDELSRVTSTTDADNKSSFFEYDPLSRVTALVDAIGQRYRFNYNPVGAVTHIRRGSDVATFTYDAVGNRKTRTDYNGGLTDYSYDALNRLKAISYPDTTTVSYTYDKLSRLQTATNENGALNFDYNKMNRLIRVKDVFGQVVEYNFDPNGSRTKLSLNSATVQTYRYDAIDRLTKILDAASLATIYTYDATNKLTSRKLPNGVLTSYQYDGMDRLTRLFDAKGVATLADHQYQYNAANRISQIAEPANMQSLGYDAIHRLTSALYTNPLRPSENYSYDAVGNRTASQLSANYNYQPFNRLTTTSTATYVYDKNGNPTSKTGSTGTTQFGWDFENRLKQVTLPNGITVSYKYDAIGRRIQRLPTSGVSTNFIYDGQDVLKDLNSDGSTVDYLNGPGVDNKLRLNDSRLATNGPLYFLQDHLGSTTTLTNSLGVSVSQLTYDAFGNSSGSALTRYDYTGRERDPDTGLLYYRARWYDPQLGRFLSEDPSDFEGGLNEYLYTDNNPIYSIDPYGLQTVGPSRNPGNFPNVYPVCTVPKGGKGIEFLPDHEMINQRHHAELENGFKRMLENCECRQAFTDLGVDLGEVWNNGVLIGSATLINDSAYSDAQIKLTGSERREARPFVNRDHAFTGTSDIDSRPHIFFNMTAHHEGLIRVLAHELLHAGGIKGQTQGDFWGALGWDDLDYLGPKYRYLLKKCGGG